MNIEKLKAIIAMCNNGYLFAAGIAELACAKANPEVFSVEAYPGEPGWHVIKVK